MDGWYRYIVLAKICSSRWQRGFPIIWSREKLEAKAGGTNFYTPEQHIDTSLLMDYEVIASLRRVALT
jgi:hypothetical protein